jgi:hypothetical protein
MQEASKFFVQIPELQQWAGRVIAQATGAEADEELLASLQKREPRRPRRLHKRDHKEITLPLKDCASAKKKGNTDPVKPPHRSRKPARNCPATGQRR